MPSDASSVDKASAIAEDNSDKDNQECQRRPLPVETPVSANSASPVAVDASKKKRMKHGKKAVKVQADSQKAPASKTLDADGAAAGSDSKADRGSAAGKVKADASSPDEKPSPGASSAIVELTESTELEALLNQTMGEQGPSGLVMACFGASWCRPCVVFAPRLKQIASRFSSVAFVKLNVDRLQEVADRYNVRAVPTFVLFKSGVHVGSVVAANPVKIEELLLEHGASPSVTAADKDKSDKVKKD